jgi:hypothetical protein
MGVAFAVAANATGQAAIDPCAVPGLPDTEKRRAFILIVAARAFGIAVKYHAGLCFRF